MTGTLLCCGFCIQRLRASYPFSRTSVFDCFFFPNTALPLLPLHSLSSSIMLLEDDGA